MCNISIDYAFVIWSTHNFFHSLNSSRIFVFFFHFHQEFRHYIIFFRELLVLDHRMYLAYLISFNCLARILFKFLSVRKLLECIKVQCRKATNCKLNIRRNDQISISLFSPAWSRRCFVLNKEGDQIYFFTLWYLIKIRLFDWFIDWQRGNSTMVTKTDTLHVFPLS